MDYNQSWTNWILTFFFVWNSLKYLCIPWSGPTGYPALHVLCIDSPGSSWAIGDWYLLKQNKISPRRHAEDRDLEKQAFVFGFKIVWKKKNNLSNLSYSIPKHDGIGKGLGMRKRTFDHINEWQFYCGNLQRALRQATKAGFSGDCPGSWRVSLGF